MLQCLCNIILKLITLREVEKNNIFKILETSMKTIRDANSFVYFSIYFTNLAILIASCPMQFVLLFPENYLFSIARSTHAKRVNLNTI